MHWVAGDNELGGQAKSTPMATASHSLPSQENNIHENPLSRPEHSLRSTMRGGGEKRAGRAGPPLLHALWHAGQCHQWVPAGAPSGWMNLASRAENVSLLGICATVALSMEAVAVFADPFGTCHMANEDADNAIQNRGG